jgi:hypothetical protein
VTSHGARDRCRSRLRVEVGASQVAQTVEQRGQPVAVGNDMIEEALPFLPRHLGIAQQFRRATDRSHRRFELVADMSCEG